jgi:hypothetical protein
VENYPSITFLDGVDHFWKIAPFLPPLYFKVDGHFNERGSEEMAKFIVTSLAAGWAR